MQPIIRPAIETDMPVIMDLLRLKAEFDGCSEAFKATPDQLRRAFFSTLPQALVLLAEHQGVAIGIATYFPTFSTFLARPGIWLDDLFVREQYRSRGVGKALLSHLARVAEETGCGRIEWTVALDNDRGISFYEAHGGRVRHLSRCVRLDGGGIERLSSDVPRSAEVLG